MSKNEEKIDEAAALYGNAHIKNALMLDRDATRYEKCIAKFHAYDLATAFEQGANFALSHQWRSTKDEKPNGNEKMLYILRDGSLSLGYFVNDDYQRFWLPIPPLPEARKEGEV